MAAHGLISPQRKLPTLTSLGYAPNQAHVMRQILQTGLRMGASQKELLAAMQTKLVETPGDPNPGMSTSDQDSAGWRQERSHYGPESERRNVKRAAERFFTEIRSERRSGRSAGERAANVQRPREDLRGRYQEETAPAGRILSTFLARRGIKAKGLPAGQGSRTPSAVKLGKIAQSRFGLRVAENPKFDPVDPVHTTGSWHYKHERGRPKRGLAIDVSGDPAKLAAFNRFVAKRYGSGVTEMFYDRGINIKNGKVTGPIGGHGGHVHIAIAEPGAQAFGVSGPVGAIAGAAQAAQSSIPTQQITPPAGAEIAALPVPTAPTVGPAMTGAEEPVGFRRSTSDLSPMARGLLDQALGDSLSPEGLSAIEPPLGRRRRKRSALAP